MSSHFPAPIAVATALLLLIAEQTIAAAVARDAGPGNGLSEPTVSDDAAEAEFRPDYTVCLKQHRALRPSEHCTAQEIEFQNAQLSAEYHALLTQLNGAARDALVADQQRWSKALNDECLVFSHRQGSLGSVNAQDCFLYGAARRRVVLDQQYGSGRR